MRVVGWAAALVLMVVTVVPAQAMNWSLGANLGYSMISPAYTGAEKTNLFGWPSSTNGVTPGLRIGFTGENPQHEFYFDTGLSITSTTGISSRDFIATANYQYNFGASGSVAPYLTAGGGLLLTGGKIEALDIDYSATSAVLGGGVGIRHKMGNGHGTLRAEARFDRTTEGKDNDELIIPKANVFGLKLGFDLWDK